MERPLIVTILPANDWCSATWKLWILLWLVLLET